VFIVSDLRSACIDSLLVLIVFLSVCARVCMCDRVIVYHLKCELETGLCRATYFYVDPIFLADF
jgi:hypothetical protein